MEWFITIRPIWLKRSVLPHPAPLPLGEGTAVAPLECFERFAGQFHCRFAAEAAKESPSPGGRGWGEGEWTPCHPGGDFR